AGYLRHTMLDGSTFVVASNAATATARLESIEEPSARDKTKPRILRFTPSGPSAVFTSELGLMETLQARVALDRFLLKFESKILSIAPDSILLELPDTAVLVLQRKSHRFRADQLNPRAAPVVVTATDEIPRCG